MRRQKQVSTLGGGRTPYIVCATTKEYRYQVHSLVSEHEVVLEIGSSYGKTTALIGNRTKYVCGVDIGKAITVESRGRYPALRFFCHDASDVEKWWQSVLPPNCEKFTLVFVDIAGTVDISYLLPILEKVESVLDPKIMVVKSLNFAKLLKQLAHGETLKAGPTTSLSKSRPSEPGGIGQEGSTFKYENQLESLDKACLEFMQQKGLKFTLSTCFPCPFDRKSKIGKSKAGRAAACGVLSCPTFCKSIPCYLEKSDRLVTVILPMGLSLDDASFCGIPLGRVARRCKTTQLKNIGRGFCELNQKYMLAPPFLSNSPVLFCDSVVNRVAATGQPICLEINFGKYARIAFDDFFKEQCTMELITKEMVTYAALPNVNEPLVVSRRRRHALAATIASATILWCYCIP